MVRLEGAAYACLLGVRECCPVRVVKVGNFAYGFQSHIEFFAQDDEDLIQKGVLVQRMFFTVPIHCLPGLSLAAGAAIRVVHVDDGLLCPTTGTARTLP